MNVKETSTIEIDVIVLFKSLWHKKFLILFVSLFVAVLAFLASTFLLQKEYTSTTRIYVVNRTDNNITNQDLQAGSYLVNDYKEIITSADVINQVIEKEKLSRAPKVSVAIPSDTRVISISIKAYSAKEAARVANTIREVAIQKIKDVAKVEDVTTLEVAKVPNAPSSPDVKRNTLLGFLVGAFLTMVAVILAEVLDDRVKSAEDVENKLELTLLGTVPDMNKL
ncbi:Wzz/FepE/Etk N-terminal domain-containing protein [Streptococcus sciuri]|uniref:Capsular polysaccharide biosynthesis protein CpsC n=1 Tax=Streptococcus sciuri TaxID=2973939 RepID=A0ABT2F5I7_9STRE|nr:Wzz/FepE/Etk N-terminal domain-containing protein [Streptococcus sciuri]MCS4487694.1 Wzz/FepE/Etk N-terminal domain-containing protein [Streptococcus sciuri]